MPNYSGVWSLSQQFQAVGQGLWPFDDGTVGIFALGTTGSASATRNKYTYSGCAVAAATASSGASQRGSATSNGIIGITL